MKNRDLTATEIRDLHRYKVTGHEDFLAFLEGVSAVPTDTSTWIVPTILWDGENEESVRRGHVEIKVTVKKDDFDLDEAELAFQLKRDKAAARAAEKEAKLLKAQEKKKKAKTEASEENFSEPLEGVEEVEEDIV